MSTLWKKGTRVQVSPFSRKFVGMSGVVEEYDSNRNHAKVRFDTDGYIRKINASYLVRAPDLPEDWKLQASSRLDAALLKMEIPMGTSLQVVVTEATFLALQQSALKEKPAHMQASGLTTFQWVIPSGMVKVSPCKSGWTPIGGLGPLSDGTLVCMTNGNIKTVVDIRKGVEFTEILGALDSQVSTADDKNVKREDAPWNF